VEGFDVGPGGLDLAGDRAFEGDAASVCGFELAGELLAVGEDYCVGRLGGCGCGGLGLSVEKGRGEREKEQKCGANGSSPEWAVLLILPLLGAGFVLLLDDMGLPGQTKDKDGTDKRNKERIRAIPSGVGLWT